VKKINEQRKSMGQATWARKSSATIMLIYSQLHQIWHEELVMNTEEHVLKPLNLT